MNINTLGSDVNIKCNTAWQKLAEKRIFFGHKSVGSNIIEGMREVLGECPNNTVRITQTSDSREFDKAIFAEFSVGENKYPLSKIHEFKKIMDGGVGEKVDIAFFKFCFADIEADADIEKIFKEYIEVFDYLGAKYPRVCFLHITVPLMTINSGLKARIRKLFGLSVWGEDDNMKRCEFNRMLLSKYGNKVFDLAGIESTYPNGERAQYRLRGQDYNYLIKSYTDDGGHLNKIGKRVVASHLLDFLSNKGK